MAHPIMSFNFGEQGRICFSVETRPVKGENYSAIGGLYRQYELIYLAVDERDVVRVRTNYRKGEDVYLYHLNFTPEHARLRFMDYVNEFNRMHQQAVWYNAITHHCTTSIRTQHDSAKRMKWDWRILAKGKSDEMLFEDGKIANPKGLSFEELKRRAHINERAKLADKEWDFSKLIREGVE